MILGEIVSFLRFGKEDKLFRVRVLIIQIYTVPVSAKTVLGFKKYTETHNDKGNNIEGEWDRRRRVFV